MHEQFGAVPAEFNRGSFVFLWCLEGLKVLWPTLGIATEADIPEVLAKCVHNSFKLLVMNYIHNMCSLQLLFTSRTCRFFGEHSF